MYLDLFKNHHDTTWFFDIETDGLDPTTVWCAVFKRFGQEPVKFFNDRDDFPSFRHDLSSFLRQILASGAILVAHNGVSFDVPVLSRLIGVDIPPDRLVDTLVLSYLHNPALPGGHSLDSYGVRLGFPKLQHDDWSRFSPEMLERCTTDVLLLELVYTALTKRMNRIGFSELSCHIEHESRRLVDRQTRHGFWFNVPEAVKLHKFLRDKEQELRDEVHKQFPPELVEIATFLYRQKKDGTQFESFKKHVDKYPEIRYNPDGTYTCLDWQTFNIGSPKQRLDRLLALGFDSDTKTPSGLPKVDEDSLLAFFKKSGHVAVKAMADWLVHNGRGNMVETWLNNVGADGRMHGRVMTCGATTRRMTHSSPNCVPLYSLALTRNGWKTYNQLVVGEDILAYDLKTQTKKWTPLLAVSVFPEANIFSFGQRHPGKRLYCTEDHSWVVKDRDCKGYKNTEKLVKANKLKHNRPIKINAPFENDVTESKFSLIQEKYERDWTSDICKLSNPELNAIMQGFLLADGCRHGKNWVFAQAEGHLLETFQTCLYLISDTRISACQKRPLRSPNQRMGYNVVQTSNMFMRTKDMSLRFEGVESVWCPTTEFGTWVMKQGDFITITGNTANIPSAKKALYGKECRSLWGVDLSRGLLEVGADAAGLETVGLLHYLGNKKAESILTKEKPDDVHSMNARALTKALSRDIDREWGAKTSWYAWLYGAYPKKLGEIVKGPKEDGDVVIETFFRNVPGLKGLISGVQDEWDGNDGLLRCVDGGYVRCPSRNAALNYRIQSLGSIVMKLGAMILRSEADKAGLWFETLGTIHDEWQMEALSTDAETLGKLSVTAISMAAEQLDFKLPLGGSYNIGNTWADCH